MTYPSNFLYTKEHEWVRVEDGVGTIGITDHAQKELGDIVYVDLPKPGTTTEKGKTFGSVESVKAVSDVYAPVTGEIVEVNELLATAPETLNESAHETGWLIKVRLQQPEELKQLLSPEDYQSYVGEE